MFVNTAPRLARLRKDVGTQSASTCRSIGSRYVTRPLPVAMGNSVGVIASIAGSGAARLDKGSLARRASSVLIRLAHNVRIFGSRAAPSAPGAFDVGRRRELRSLRRIFASGDLSVYTFQRLGILWWVPSNSMHSGWLSRLQSSEHSRRG